MIDSGNAGEGGVFPYRTSRGHYLDAFAPECSDRAPHVADAVGDTAESTPRISGAPRNIHLHVEDPGYARDAVRAALAERSCDALVLTCKEAIDEGLWGPGDPSETFERHCGDLLVIPDELGVWHAGESAELDLVGMHGGCHPDEMIVPFAAAHGDRLQ